MQENEASTTRDLFNACAVLFGTDVNVSAEFLKYLQTPGLKAAYRKKAFETHPDRATSLAESPLSLEERFKELNLAYEQLSTFVKYPWKYSWRDPGFQRATESDSTGRKRRTHEADDQKRSGNSGPQGHRYAFSEPLWRGNLPGKRLLLGQFLYYSGMISMKSLIEAIVWQKRQRPRVGSIAVHWDWLAQDEIRSILAGRKSGEKFCECALRYGYISPHQLNLLLWRQRLLQPRIGRFFVDRKIVTPCDMEHIVEQSRAHNRKYWRA